MSEVSSKVRNYCSGFSRTQLGQKVCDIPLSLSALFSLVLRCTGYLELDDDFVISTMLPCARPHVCMYIFQREVASTQNCRHNQSDQLQYIEPVRFQGTYGPNISFPKHNLIRNKPQYLHSSTKQYPPHHSPKLQRCPPSHVYTQVLGYSTSICS